MLDAMEQPSAEEVENKEFLYGRARELLDLMARGTTHQEENVVLMDTRCYLDEERFKAEKFGVFRQSPLIVAMSCELRQPGDFKLHEDTDVPLLITRDSSGEVHVFLNSCRHRGVKVTDEPCGHASRFTCPYHAWSYGTDGALLALPGQEVFGDVDKRTLGLVEFPSEERGGLIFTVLTPGASLDLDGFLAGGADHLFGWHFDRTKLVAESPLETRANWKLALDTFTENYHFHVLHAQDFHYKVKNCAGHWRFGDRNQHWCLAWPSKSLEEMRNLPEAEWGQVNVHFSMLYYLFPNTVIALYPDTCTVMHLYPGKIIGEQTTQLKFYAREAAPAAETVDRIAQRLQVFIKVLQTEDYLVCGQAWEAISTGLLPELIYGRNEPALIWTHEALDAATEAIMAPAT